MKLMEGCSNLILCYERSDTGSILVEQPYHHSVINYTDQPIAKAFSKVSNKIHNLAKILQVLEQC